MRGDGEDDELAGGTGVYNQPPQITDHSSPEDPVFGVHSRFQLNEAVPPTGEVPEHRSELPVADETTNGYGLPLGKFPVTTHVSRSFKGNFKIIAGRVE